MVICLQGPNWLRNHWESNGVQWSDFLPDEAIEAFMNEKVSKIEFGESLLAG